MGTSKRGWKDEKASARRRLTDRLAPPGCQFAQPRGARDRGLFARPRYARWAGAAPAPRRDYPMPATSPLAPARFPDLTPIAGVRLAAYAAGIRYTGRND